MHYLIKVMRTLTPVIHEQYSALLDLAKETKHRDEGLALAAVINAHSARATKTLECLARISQRTDVSEGQLREAMDDVLSEMRQGYLATMAHAIALSGMPRDAKKVLERAATSFKRTMDFVELQATRVLH